ncbi:MAG: hypothetical protein ACE5H0_11195, partial [Bacteroidota bacterium]
SSYLSVACSNGSTHPLISLSSSASISRTIDLSLPMLRTFPGPVAPSQPATFQVQALPSSAADRVTGRRLKYPAFSGLGNFKD